MPSVPMASATTAVDVPAPVDQWPFHRKHEFQHNLLAVFRINKETNTPEKALKCLICMEVFGMHIEQESKWIKHTQTHRGPKRARTSSQLARENERAMNEPAMNESADSESSRVRAPNEPPPSERAKPRATVNRQDAMTIADLRQQVEDQKKAVEDQKKTINNLKAQIEQLRHSAAYGLAVSYYFNFLLPVCTQMRLQSDNGGVSQFEVNSEGTMKGQQVWVKSNLFVLIPSDLKRYSNIKVVLTHCVESNIAVTGRVQQREGAERLHRVMTQFLYLSNEQLVAIDMPTVLSSIRELADATADKLLTTEDDEERNNIVRVNIASEIQQFIDHLQFLIKTDPRCAQLVKLLITPPLPWESPEAVLSSLFYTEH